jgi:uncharacterized protein
MERQVAAYAGADGVVVARTSIAARWRWANRAQAKWQFIEPGDVEAALQTASAIGDDRLQRQAQGYVVPDAFTVVHYRLEVRRNRELRYVSLGADLRNRN